VVFNLPSTNRARLFFVLLSFNLSSISFECSKPQYLHLLFDKIENVLKSIKDGLQSACSYSGVSNLEDLYNKGDERVSVVAKPLED
jgi:hypothetical protein